MRANRRMPRARCVAAPTYSWSRTYRSRCCVGDAERQTVPPKQRTIKARACLKAEPSSSSRWSSLVFSKHHTTVQSTATTKVALSCPEVPPRMATLDSVNEPSTEMTRGQACWPASSWSTRKTYAKLCRPILGGLRGLLLFNGLRSHDHTPAARLPRLLLALSRQYIWALVVSKRLCIVGPSMWAWRIAIDINNITLPITQLT